MPTSALPPLRTFLVLYRESEGNMVRVETPEVFRCQAEDTDHAEEQCRNAYPEATIVWTWVGDNVEACFRDWYGAAEDVEHMPGMCGRCLDEVPLFPANCQEKPELWSGAPLGMYHCSDCGTMLLAGFPHPPLCQRCNDREHPEFDPPKEAPADIMTPPPDCPLCGGQTEWDERRGETWFARCHFCGFKFGP